jgi:hypothetical protein
MGMTARVQLKKPICEVMKRQAHYAIVFRAHTVQGAARATST